MTPVLSLTEDQRNAVDSNSKRILLLAPAGSGKTEVLVRRIERLLADSVGQAHRLLCVTYTVKAAEHLKARVDATIASEAWRVDCYTLHGLALDWLKRYGAAVGVGPNPVVYSDDTDRLRIIAEYLESLGLDSLLANRPKGFLTPVLKAIDDHRTLSPDVPVPDTIFETIGVALPELFDAYVTSLNKLGGVDFPALLIKLQELLVTDSWVLSNFRRTYEHVLVDEAQDLTPAQAQLLSTLIGAELNVFLVADDRQSINSFAGGSFANAQKVAGSDAVILQLRHNFRCSTHILAAAERLVSDGSPARSVAAAAGAPSGEVQFVKHADASDEARGVVAWISGLLTKGLDPEIAIVGEDLRVAPEDIAIIARARWLLDAVVEELGAQGILVSFPSEPSAFLRSRLGRLVFESLCVIADPKDRPAQRRFIEEFPPALEANAFADPIEVLNGLDDHWMRALAQALRGTLHGPLGLDRFFNEVSTSLVSEEWSQDAEILSNFWRRYSLDVMAPHRSLRGFLGFLARAQSARASDPGVRVMTIHRVKGLEFRAVALLSVYDGALPDYRAKTKKDLDSERRSLYVAMTRAQRVLRVSWPASTTDRWGRSRSQQPSRFLLEAGLIERTR